MKRRFNREFFTPYLFLLPQILLVGIFALYPLLYNLLLSFQDEGMFSRGFVGLDEYVEIFADPIFWIALRNTLYYTVGTVPLTAGLALLAAFGLNQSIRGQRILRAIYLAPYLISWVVCGVLWQWMYSNNFGICNQVLNWFGLPGLAWLQNPALTIPSLIIASVWHGLGYYMVIFLAGLQSISPVYYEASLIDGASKGKQFWMITLPLLKPILFVVLVLAMISSFKVFDQIYVMTGGGPGRASLMLVNYIYSVIVTEMRLSYAAALSMVLFLIIMGLTIFQRQIFPDSDAEVE
jgi:ABC-type sugar transport system permease subunit